MPPSSRSSAPRRHPFIWISVALILIAAVIYRVFFAGHAAPPPAPGAPEVGVVQVEAREITDWTEYSGRLVAVNQAEIRPQVSGTITQILFKEGSQVKKGQQLFTIDTRPYQNALAQARASLATATSQASLGNIQLSRAQKLLSGNVVSKSVVDERRATASTANSQVHAAQAAVKLAQINLEYANVLAPIDGRIGRAELTVGNSVQAGPNAPILTTIVANAKIYADFDVDERTYVTTIRGEGNAKAPVEMHLSSLPDVTYTGTIQSFDNNLDPTTGTIRARAVFVNKDGALTPGMYAAIRLGSPTQSRQLLVPEAAINTDQDRKFVMVVSADNKAEYRPVTLGKTVEDKQVVLSGVKESEKVITTGLQRARPGSPVTPKDAASLQPPAASATTEAKG